MDLWMRRGSQAFRGSLSPTRAGWRGGECTDVEGLQEGHPDLPTTTFSMERQEVKLTLVCRKHTPAHTQSRDVALSHNLNWLPGAYWLPCSPKALCMFSECLAYAVVTWDPLSHSYSYFSPSCVCTHGNASTQTHNTAKSFYPSLLLCFSHQKVN